MLLRAYRRWFVFISLSLVCLSYLYGDAANLAMSIIAMTVLQFFHLMMLNGIINGDEVIYIPRGIRADLGLATKIAVKGSFVVHHTGILMIFSHSIGLFHN